ncbi:MAG: HD domain-containing protein [Polyangiaceae bacterium]
MNQLFDFALCSDPARVFDEALRRGELDERLPALRALVGVTQSAPHVFDVWEHTLAVIDGVREMRAVSMGRPCSEATTVVARGLGSAFDVVREACSSEERYGRLIVAALLHDIAKPDTRSVGEDGRIHFYRHEERGAEVARARLAADPTLRPSDVDAVEHLVLEHLRPAGFDRTAKLTRRLIGKFRRDLGELAPDVCVLAIADRMGKGGRADEAAWVRYTSRLDEALTMKLEDAPPPRGLITGDDLLERGVSPGRRMGAALRAVAEAEARGELTDSTAALAYALAFLERNPG